MMDISLGVKPEGFPAATMEQEFTQLMPTSLTKRHVRFPSDDCLVTVLSAPPDLVPKGADDPSSQDVLSNYYEACARYNTQPLQKLMDQLMAIEFTGGLIAPALSLRGERLDSPQVESMEEVLRWVRFRILDISDTMLDDEGATALFDMLEFYDGVENLNISGQKQMSERGWSACARLIRRAASLQALYIRHCTLDSTALRHIGRALQLGSLLSEMHLERSPLGGAGLAQLVSGARVSTNLKRLHLSGCRLGPADGTHLGILLRQSRSLEVLDVDDNLLQDSGIMQLLTGFVANRDSKLTDLRLSANQLTAQSAAAVASALAASGLRNISLARNNVGTEGVLAMRDGLLRCALESVDLSETRINCEAAIALAEVAVESRTLSSIDLRGNLIKTAGVMALSLAARLNSRLTSVEVDRTRPTLTKSVTVDSNSSTTSTAEELMNLTNELDRQLATNRKVQPAEQSQPTVEVESDYQQQQRRAKLFHSRDAALRRLNTIDADDVLPDQASSLQALYVDGEDGSSAQTMSVKSSSEPSTAVENFFSASLDDSVDASTAPAAEEPRKEDNQIVKEEDEKPDTEFEVEPYASDTTDLSEKLAAAKVDEVTVEENPPDLNSEESFASVDKQEDPSQEIPCDNSLQINGPLDSDAAVVLSDENPPDFNFEEIIPVTNQEDSSKETPEDNSLVINGLLDSDTAAISPTEPELSLFSVDATSSVPESITTVD